MAETAKKPNIFQRWARSFKDMRGEMKKNDPDRLEMNKYCRFCRKHTVHRETK